MTDGRVLISTRRRRRRRRVKERRRMRASRPRRRGFSFLKVSSVSGRTKGIEFYNRLFPRVIIYSATCLRRPIEQVLNGGGAYIHLLLSFCFFISSPLVLCRLAVYRVSAALGERNTILITRRAYYNDKYTIDVHRRVREARGSPGRSTGGRRQNE